MATACGFVVVGGDSAAAVIAARLSEVPNARVVLVEAGERPPERELMPADCAAWNSIPRPTGCSGLIPCKAEFGLKGWRMRTPPGKMLGGLSGINYMVWVRGHPQEFDHWAELGAEGWN